MIFTKTSTSYSLLKSAFIVLSLACGGCTFHNKPAVPEASERVSKNIEKAIAAIQQTQMELYQYSEVQQKKNGISGGIYSDNVKIDANWNGDAVELLKQMAAQRHYSFSSSGVKLPLPVSLKVDKVEYRDVLELIQIQIGYSASIIINNSRRDMHLRYGPATNNTAFGPRVVYQQPVNASPKPKPISSGMLTVGAKPLDSLPAAGDQCAVEGSLSRNTNGKAMRCNRSKWKIMR